VPVASKVAHCASLLGSYPGEHATLDAGEISDQEATTRRRTDRAACCVGDGAERLLVAVHIAAHDRCDLRVDVAGISNKILDLDAARGPAAGGGAMILKGTANAPVGTAAVEHGVDLGVERGA
jgi:hypothetical protein